MSLPSETDGASEPTRDELLANMPRRDDQAACDAWHRQWIRAGEAEEQDRRRSAVARLVSGHGALAYRSGVALDASPGLRDFIATHGERGLAAWLGARRGSHARLLAVLAWCGLLGRAREEAAADDFRLNGPYDEPLLASLKGERTMGVSAFVCGKWLTEGLRQAAPDLEGKARDAAERAADGRLDCDDLLILLDDASRSVRQAAQAVVTVAPAPDYIDKFIALVRKNTEDDFGTTKQEAIDEAGAAAKAAGLDSDLDAVKHWREEANKRLNRLGETMEHSKGNRSKLYPPVGALKRDGYYITAKRPD